MRKTAPVSASAWFIPLRRARFEFPREPEIPLLHPVDIGDLPQVSCSDCHTGGVGPELSYGLFCCAVNRRESRAGASP
jgi:hypothetical protein